MKKILLPVLLIILCIAAAFSYLLFVRNKNTSTATPSPIIERVTQGLEGANWSEVQVARKNLPSGTLEGKEKAAIITSDEASIPHFEDVAYLQSEGFAVDNTLAADGPGSSTWGYKRQVGEKEQVLVFSYSTSPTSSQPNEPLSFNCPCDVTVSVFLSEPFMPQEASTTLANPASENCIKQGGTLAIQKLGNGSEYGLCQFQDNMACEEWALFRGQCPVGGVKTTGYDTIDQMYCAWLGGKTLAVPNSQCTLPNSTVCSTKDLYAGTCN